MTAGIAALVLDLVCSADRKWADQVSHGGHAERATPPEYCDSSNRTPQGGWINMPMITGNGLGF